MNLNGAHPRQSARKSQRGAGREPHKAQPPEIPSGVQGVSPTKHSARKA